MNWFNNLRTGPKLMLGFALIAAGVLAVGLLGMKGLGAGRASMDEVQRDRKALGELRIALSEIAHTGRAVSELVLDDDHSASRNDVHAATLAALRASTTKHLETVASALHSAEDKAQFQKVVDARAAARELNDVATAAAMKGDRVAAMNAVEQNARLMQAIDDEAAKLESHLQTIADRRYHASMEEFQTLREEVIAVIVAAVIFALLAGWLIARSLAGPLRQSVAALDRVAAGDFTTHLAIDRKDEVGQLAASLDRATINMRTALQQVRSVSEGVAGAASELAGASQAISSGAQQQASSLEESAASIEEMTATIKQSADNARTASQLALGSRESAEKGGLVVEQAVAAMAEINQSSKKIAEIITAIDEIAFQTNLLALNAAVEAARAGEQGRGFAVVATEVRNLAQRSASAAKEIKGLIQDSVRKVDIGSELVNRSGITLGEIVASVKRVTDIVTEMASAAREQSTGIDQINKAITQMDQVTQSNAASTEEMSATAQGLTNQAEELRGTVAKFKLNDQESSQPAFSAARSRAVAKPMVIRSSRTARPAPRAAASRSGNGHNGHGASTMDSRMSDLGAAGFEET